MPPPTRTAFLTLLSGGFAAASLARRVDAAPGLHIPSDFDARIRTWADGRVPGIAIGWIDGKRRGVINFGTARAGSRVDDDTVFEAASLSKPAFALGVRALHARGRLDLDAPISRIVDLRDETDDERVFAITPRQALTHTTGLPNWRFELQPLRCSFAPGTRFAYSGEGIFLLQRAVERVTGDGLAAFMASTVLAPLGMHSSSFAFERRFSDRLAAPHAATGAPSERRTAKLGEQLLRLAATRNVPLERWTWPVMKAHLPKLDPPQRPLPVFSPINAASSLLTTATDYTRIVRALTNRSEITEAQIAVTSGIAWGLGVGLETGARPFAFQWGDNDGFKALMEADTAFERGVVVLTNSDAGIPVALRIERALIGERPSLEWIDARYKTA